MNIYKVKMSAYKIVPVTREVRIIAEDTIEAERLAQNDWFEQTWLEGNDFEGGEIHTDSIEIVEEL